MFLDETYVSLPIGQNISTLDARKCPTSDPTRIAIMTARSARVYKFLRGVLSPLLQICGREFTNTEFDPWFDPCTRQVRSLG